MQNLNPHRISSAPLVESAYRWHEQEDMKPRDISLNQLTRIKPAFRCLAADAGDIHLRPMPEGLGRYRIDGVLRDITTYRDLSRQWL